MRVGKNIYKRKDGRYEGRCFDSKKGKIVSIYGKTEEEVESKIQLKKKESLLVCNVAKKWLDSIKETIDSASYNSYTSIINNHIIPFTKKMYIYEFEDDKKLNELICKLKAKKIASSTFNNIMSIFKLFLNYCIDEEIIEMYNISILQKEIIRKDLNIMSDEAENTLKEYLFANITDKNYIILLSLFTGLKTGEVCSIKYSDINIVNGTLYLRAFAKRVPISNDDSNYKSKIAEIKYESIRSIPLPDFLVSIFIQLKLKAKEDTYIFSNTPAIPDPRAVQDYLKRISSKLGINESITFSTLRDTFTYKAIKLGFNAKVFSDILGINIRDIYYEYLEYSDDTKRTDMDKLKIYM